MKRRLVVVARAEVTHGNSTWGAPLVPSTTAKSFHWPRESNSNDRGNSTEDFKMLKNVFVKALQHLLWISNKCLRFTHRVVLIREYFSKPFKDLLVFVLYRSRFLTFQVALLDLVYWQLKMAKRTQPKWTLPTAKEMPQLKIYNSLTRRKEVFVPQNGNQAGIV